VTGATSPWPVVHHREPAGTFHRRPLPEPLARQVWVCQPSAPALVLGSAQRDDVVDRAACETAGVEVVRRRSGGGAVLVEPGALLWVDVLLPSTDTLWQVDVGRAFEWLGEAWSAAFAELGRPVEVHRGALRRTPWSSLVCFAGLGPGELTDGAGAKVLGMSQRRTREGARFQCAALGHWEPDAILSLLALDDEQRRAAKEPLAHVAAGAGADLDALLDSFLRHLP
jgi:lipoate-protein ligase A